MPALRYQRESTSYHLVTGSKDLTLFGGLDIYVAEEILFNIKQDTTLRELLEMFAIEVGK